LETAKRALQNCSRIFRYAIAAGRREDNPAEHLRGAIPPGRERHLAAITTPKEFGALMRAIDAYTGTIVVRFALQLMPLVFVRPGELRAAEWTEINWEKAEWHIPAIRMKMPVKRIVPLFRQALAILREIQLLTGTGRYVFPRYSEQYTACQTWRSSRRCEGWVASKARWQCMASGHRHARCSMKWESIRIGLSGS
jgi:integrase